ncbi:hypothetical protein BU24DRAFT_454587 [Aaosphaeria arxii CBS 175.79]|uniref:Uncharacterized protein n=1 Tax=Aaosphaeria arxii CBS 175.79 TaxID=1450172 RepID=A0A6A5XE28_9PLEO|nr:uncharacterized protein BU24DRAFT_454587 [Aaosphaeria arxii CBS 175.79]KAF2011096.1 hypothetical protein BU24DRAFT_454587 [Aaosphaeria arxii CBS 175.79]
MPTAKKPKIIVTEPEYQEEIPILERIRKEYPKCTEMIDKSRKIGSSSPTGCHVPKNFCFRTAVDRYKRELCFARMSATQFWGNKEIELRIGGYDSNDKLTNSSGPNVRLKMKVLFKKDKYEVASTGGFAMAEPMVEQVIEEMCEWLARKKEGKKGSWGDPSIL